MQSYGFSVIYQVRTPKYFVFLAITKRWCSSFLNRSFGHADGTCGADEAAEMAANALCAYDSGLSGLGVEGDGLMASVLT